MGITKEKQLADTGFKEKEIITLHGEENVKCALVKSLYDSKNK